MALPAALAGMLAVTLAGAPPAGAVDRGTFELDGNATASATLAGDDWGNALKSGLTAPANYAPSPDQLVNTGVVADPKGTTIFTGGASKDDLDVPGWKHTAGSVPDKDEITNAYAAAYTKGAAKDLVVYFGADRFATSGNAAVGFWFFQQKVAPVVPGTTFTNKHSDGDLLVLSTFTNGGAQPTTQVYEWKAGGAINGTLELLTNSSSTCNATQGGTAAEPKACAIVNSAPQPAPWSYTPKSGAPNVFAPGAFFEGGVNVTELYKARNQSTPCFSSFLAETRSSQSVDATLKDFVAGDFPLCSAKLSITGSGVNEVGTPHTFTVKAEKTVAGTTAGVAGVQPVVTLSPAPSGAQPLDNGTCDDPGTGADGTCTVIFNSDRAGVIVGSATATITVAGESFTTATGTTAETGAAVKRYVDARISINPPLDTNGITEQHTFTVAVQQDDGLDAAAGGDGLTGFGPAPDGTKPDVTLTPTGGAAVTGRTDNCLTTGTVAGSCTVVFTSNSAGTVTGTATATLTVGGLTLSRTTDGSTTAPGGTATNSNVAVKHFVAGSLTFLKVDQDGAALGGATFRVCRTTSYNSATLAHTALTPPDCRSVLDNTAPDTDPTAGTFTLTGLIMGTYTVQETAAPTGYSFDASLIRSADVVTTAPDASITTAFVNKQLYKLIVLTCNQVTNELVQSTVTLNGAVKDTVATPTGPSDLCSLGGANFGNLPKGTYVPSVVLPKATP